MALRTSSATALLAAAAAALALTTSTGATGAAPGGRGAAYYPGGAKAAGRVPHLELFRTGFKNAGEPNIGIDKTGTIWSDVREQAVRSVDGGRHWQKLAIDGHLTTLDPYLYVDRTTGRVYKSDLAGTCQVLSWSDDRGETWSHAPAACNQSDHQTIVAGKPATLPTVGYPNVLYNCSQTVGYNGYSTATGCARSLDGGMSWTPSGAFAYADPSPYVPDTESGDGGVPGVCNGDTGPIFAGPDGRLYVPRGWCGQPWLAYSDDEGATFTRVQVAKNGMNTTIDGGFGVVAPGHGQADHEAAAVADKKGNVYYLWMAKDRLPYLAVSHDRGATFGAPLKVAPPGVREAWGPSLDIDDKGRVAMAFMGSTNSPGAPWTASYASASFTGYLGLIAKPSDRKPVVVAGPVSRPNAPFVYGHCGPDRCDDGVLDFIDVAFAPDGSVWGAFVDSALGDELVMGHLKP
jgi:hypothetical protein